MRSKLTRRELLRAATGAAVAAPAGVVTPGCMTLAPGARYMNPEAPTFALPQIEGTYYADEVPDTLDLADMAARLIHAMTAPTDPGVDYEVYWWVIFGTNRPHMVHQFSDQFQFQYMAVLPLMRVASGHPQGEEVERSFLAGTIKNLGPDGLFYNVPAARPWTVSMDQSFKYADKPPEGPFASLIQSALMLSMLNVYSQLSPDERWQQAARRCGERLVHLAVDAGEYAYYHKWQYALGEAPSKGPMTEDPFRGGAVNAILMPLLELSQLTGYEPARRTASKLFEQYMRFWTGIEDDGKVAETRDGWTYSGFPIMSSLVPLDWGIRADEPEMIETAQENFDRYRYLIQPLTGYVPEVTHTDPTKVHTAESCFLSYVVTNAVLLSAVGAGDYWDDVDRWVRNQFAETQLTRVDWVEPMLEGKSWQFPPRYSTTERVPQRNLGAFAGFMQFNDWYGGYVHPTAKRAGGAAIQHCCTGTAGLTIYNVWKNILHYKGEELRINLLLNRASQWADIHSHIPYRGQVDVKVKEPLKLAVRIPEWTKPLQVRVQVDGQDRTVSWEDRYVQVGDLKPKQVATLRFPISERKEIATVHGQTYTLTIKGNTVVAIDPPGQYYPVYQRAHYRDNTTRWRTATRFVSDTIPREGHALCV